VTLAEQWKQREAEFRLFRYWETVNPPGDRPLAEIMADVSAMWNRLPEDVRTIDPDPEKLGVQRMHLALRVLSGNSDGTA